jgi:hypothetical protein
VKEKFLEAELKRDEMIVDQQSAMMGRKFEPPRKSQTQDKVNTMRCFKCGKQGHLRKDCWFNKSASKDFGKNCGKGSGKGSGSNSGGNDESSSGHKKREKFVSERKDAMITEVQKRRMPFVLDSGASDHMVCDEDLLGEKRNLEEPIKVSIAKEGDHITATKKGSVKLMSQVGLNKVRNLKLYNVLFIPNLKTNLLSVR